MSQKRSSSQNKQTSFDSVSGEFRDYWKASGRKVHGGSHAQDLRKTKRPFDSQKPMHLVLKAEHAQGPLSMWNARNKTYIQKTIDKHAVLCDVRIYRFSNNGNHLHLAVRAKEKRQFQRFLRSISGLIARHVLNAKKGRPAKPIALVNKNAASVVSANRNGSRIGSINTTANKKNQRKFWSALAFTRVAEWGRAFTHLSSYVLQNIMEAAGVIPHQPRKREKKANSG